MRNHHFKNKPNLSISNLIKLSWLVFPYYHLLYLYNVLFNEAIFFFAWCSVMTTNIKPQGEDKYGITVVGIGGAGINVLRDLINTKLETIDFVAIDTNPSALDDLKIKHKIHVKEIAREATLLIDYIKMSGGEHPRIDQELTEVLSDTGMIITIAGLGGFTGSVLTPIVSEIARKQGILVISVCILPSNKEEYRRRVIAEDALERLAASTKSIIIVDQDKIVRSKPIIPPNYSYNIVNSSVADLVKGLIDLFDMFPDIVVFSPTEHLDSRYAVMGIGEASGSYDKAKKALEKALSNLSAYADVYSASKVLLKIISGPELTLEETKWLLDEITSFPRNEPEPYLYWGVQLQENMKNRLKVIIIFTGISLSLRSTQIS